jgi:hypothetical protein
MSVTVVSSGCSRSKINNFASTQKETSAHGCALGQIAGVSDRFQKAKKMGILVKNWQFCQSPES